MCLAFLPGQLNRLPLHSIEDVVCFLANVLDPAVGVELEDIGGLTGLVAAELDFQDGSAAR